jgi:hypothetical protein
MKKLVGLAVLVMVLSMAGCAPLMFTRPGLTSMEFERDKAECVYQIQLSTPAAQSGYYRNYSQAAAAGIVDGVAEGLRQRGLLIQCMSLRGYSQAR